jgi:hypothetical protein
VPRLRVWTRLSTERLPPLRLQCGLRPWRLSSALPDIPIQLAAEHGLSVKRYATSHGPVSLLCPQRPLRLLHEIVRVARNPADRRGFLIKTCDASKALKARPQLEERALSHSYDLGNIPCWHLYCCFVNFTWRATRRGSNDNTLRNSPR